MNHRLQELFPFIEFDLFEDRLTDRLTIFPQDQEPFVLDVPKIHDDGTFFWNHVYRSGMSFLSMDGSLMSFKDCLIDVIAQSLIGAISREDSGIISRRVSSLCSYQPLIKETALARYIMSKRVMIEHIDTNSPKQMYLDRLNHFDLSILDMTATPQSEKMGVIAHLKEPNREVCDENPGETAEFSAALMKVPFMKYTTMKRNLIIYAGMCQAVNIAYPDPPLITVTPEIPDPPCAMLETLYMVSDSVFQDNAAISQSAADRLSCTVIKPVVVHAHGLEVKEGEYYEDGFLFCKEHGTSRHLHIPMESAQLISKVEFNRLNTRGEDIPCTRLEFAMEYAIEDGSKITNRYGHKVTLMVKPDKLMPRVNGKPVDIVVNPLSVERRRNFGQILEAVVGSYIRHLGKSSLVLPYYDSEYADIGRTLLEGERIDDYSCNSYVRDVVDCKKDQFIGWDIEQPTISGPVAWLRLSKHPRDLYKYVGCSSRQFTREGAMINARMLAVMMTDSEPATGLVEEILSGHRDINYPTDLMNGINLCGSSDLRKIDGPICSVEKEV